MAFLGGLETFVGRGLFGQLVGFQVPYNLNVGILQSFALGWVGETCFFWSLKGRGFASWVFGHFIDGFHVPNNLNVVILLFSCFLNF